MRRYTVKQLAELSGVSVRALHHYDEIGLLKPAYVGENRYRYYGREELLRLQQILIHRELGLSLAEIGSVLDAPDFDRLATLTGQRERLEREAARYAGMIRTIDRTIAELRGECAMKDAELYSGVVAPEKQAEYERWLVERYGDSMRRNIEISRKKMAALTPGEMQDMLAELADVEQGLAEGLRRGLPPQSAVLDPMIERHRAWVAASWNQECTAEAYAGLADTYLAHKDFRARYEKIEPGFAEYLATAMRSWASRQG